MDRMAQSRHSERTANLFPRGGRPLLIIEIYQPTFSVESIFHSKKMQVESGGMNIIRRESSQANKLSDFQT